MTWHSSLAGQEAGSKRSNSRLAMIGGASWVAWLCKVRAAAVGGTTSSRWRGAPSPGREGGRAPRNRGSTGRTPVGPTARMAVLTTEELRALWPEIGYNIVKWLFGSKEIGMSEPASSFEERILPSSGLAPTTAGIVEQICASYSLIG